MPIEVEKQSVKPELVCHAPFDGSAEARTAKGTKGGERDNNNDKKEKKLYEAINQSPKEVELVALKNRNGRQRFKCFFKYEMKFDTFSPDMNSRFDPDSASSVFKPISPGMSVPFKTV